MSIKTNNLVLRVVSVFTVLLLITVMAWLSQSNEDPCANPRSDIAAAVLADQEGDQDALVNRAIIMQGKCKEE